MNDPLRHCRHTWGAYMNLMERSRRCSDYVVRRRLIEDAYNWLERHFTAIEAQLPRNERITG